ncbi:integrase core domain-containing protein [Ruminococcus sp.]|uniref:integrase core domain-containing protein n=1 Tax=Ruminococcus sp. TaxID=41978 RepID=UPI0025F3F7AB|nr:integrase core domain-containing protein [Ruminococcus sp.]
MDEYSRLRFLYGYEEQSTYSSADFAKRCAAWFKRRGIIIKCIQTDNGFEFTNRFSTNPTGRQSLFERTLAEMVIRHKLIRPYTPRHNGKVERSHREDHNKFYAFHRFYSCDDLNVQLAERLSRTNNLPMRPLGWLSPIEFIHEHYPR